MFTYPEIDPVAFSLGPLRVHWYGLMYLAGFVGGWILLRRRASRPDSLFSTEQVDDIVFYSVLGVILGGRIGYVLFYDLASYIRDPLQILQVWQGGMSFHGGLLGVMTANWLYARGQGRHLLELMDTVAPVVPIGLGTGRIGNFINGELWGAPTDSWLGMAYLGEVRHPTMLYEAVLEGLVMFTVLWVYSRRPRPLGAISGLFAVMYAAFRLWVETLRLPDAHIGYLAGTDWLTMGMVLSLPLLVVGLWLIWRAHRSEGEG